MLDVILLSYSCQIYRDIVVLHFDRNSNPNHYCKTGYSVLSDQIRKVWRVVGRRPPWRNLGGCGVLTRPCSGDSCGANGGSTRRSSDRICKGLGLVLAPEERVGDFEKAMDREQQEFKMSLVADAVAGLRAMTRRSARGCRTIGADSRRSRSGLIGWRQTIRIALYFTRPRVEDYRRSGS